MLLRKKAACVDVQALLLKDKIDAFQERGIYIEEQKKKQVTARLLLTFKRGVALWKSLWS